MIVIVVACFALLLAPSSEAIGPFDDDDETAPAAHPTPCVSEGDVEYLRLGAGREIESEGGGEGEMVCVLKLPRIDLPLRCARATVHGAV